MHALIRREEDPCIQTGLHGRLHFFRLDRCIVQLSFKAMYVWPLSWLHPDPVPEPRNTRRASTVGLVNLSPRKGTVQRPDDGDEGRFSPGVLMIRSVLRTRTGWVCRSRALDPSSELQLQAFRMTIHVSLSSG